MSSVAISGNASGAGVLTIAAPNTASNYTLTLPTATTTLVGTDATQTLTNKTITGAVMTAMASSVITSGTAVASTSGTSITFSSLPSWVKRITIMLSGVSTSGTQNIVFQVGAGSVTTTGYSNILSQIAAAAASSASFTNGFQITTTGATSSIYGNFVLTNLTGNTWTGAGAVMDVTNTRTAFTTGGIALGGTLDRVVVTTNTGTDTFDAGSINILYE